MKDCRAYEPLIAELLFGALDAPEQARLEAHLDACPDCRAMAAEMQATLQLVAARRRPEPAPAFWDGYYARLEARLAQDAARPAWRERLAAWWHEAGWWHGTALRVPAWRLQLMAALVLLAAGVLIGWLLFGPSAPRIAGPPHGVEPPLETTPEAPPVVDAVPEQAPAVMPPGAPPVVDALPATSASPRETPVRPASLDARAGRYLERSKILLLGLVNLEPADEGTAGLNLPRKRAVARELVQEAGALRQALTASDQQRLRALIADLEVILLQIANLESDHDVPAIELVKSGVDRQGLLLKINLTEMQQGVRPATRPRALPDTSFF